MKHIPLSIFLLFTITMQAQVGIGTTNPNALLDIRSSNQVAPTNSDGILIPKVDEFPATNPTAVQDGLLLYISGNGTPTKGFYYWNQVILSWVSVTGVEKINDLLDGKSDNDGTDNGSSLFLGLGAGANDDASDNQNVGVGSYTLFNNTTGSQNVAIGRGTLLNNTTGVLNTAVGFSSMNFQATNGRYNTALGAYTLNQLVNSQYNTAIGYRALTSTTGGNNTAVGNESMLLTTVGGFNTALGDSSLYSNTTGVRNTAVGSNSLYSNSIGNNNVSLGFNSGYFETGSNSLYIENSNADANNALVYGEFGIDNTTSGNVLRTNSQFQIGNPTITGYAFPIADGTSNQIMQTDGSGTITWVDATSVGNTDHDFYEEGTTTAPDDINDDQFTMGNVAIGKNTADYPLDIETPNGGRGLSILLNGTSNNTHYGEFIRLEGNGSGTHNGTEIQLSGSGGGAQLGTINVIDNSGNGLHYGSYNVLRGTGTGIHYGNWARLEGSGANDQFGNYIDINNSGGGTHYGNANSLSGNGAGSHYGYWTQLSGAGNGAQVGYFSRVTNNGINSHYGALYRLEGTGNGEQIGLLNLITNQGSGNHHGIRNTMNGSSTGDKYGINTIIDRTASGNNYGIQNDLRSTAGGNQFGMRNTLTSPTGLMYGTSNVLSGGNYTHGTQNTFLNNTSSNVNYGTRNNFNSGSASNERFGTHNTFSGDGSGLENYGVFNAFNTDISTPSERNLGVYNEFNVSNGALTQIGMHNLFEQFTAGNLTGVLNEFDRAGDITYTNEVIGVHNSSMNPHTNTQYGIKNELSDDSADTYGVYNDIHDNGTGTSSNYGVYNVMSGGGALAANYGVYSSVVSSGNDYSGYFLGPLAVGTTAADMYTLPFTRGTNGQIMQTDGVGNLSWVNDPSPSYWLRTGGVLNLANATDDIAFTSDQTSISFPNTTGTPSSMIYMFQGAGNVDRMVLSHSPTYSDWGLAYEDTTDSFIFKSSSQERVEIDLAGGFPLRVYGTARAVNFQSDTTTYPDYVFESYFQGYSNLNSDYSFKSLAELESFIIENGHLPNVKSYEDVKADGMTIDVGAMAVTNLEKIEEAFLYIIELKKQNDTLQTKLESQQREIDEIKALLKNKK